MYSFDELRDETSRSFEPEHDFEHDCRGEIIVRREVTDPETTETTTQVFYETCDRKGCSTCGSQLRRCHAAHYIEQLENRMEESAEEESLYFGTMTLPGFADGTFEEMLKDLQSKRSLFLQRMRDQSRDASYVWVVETGDSGRPHLHLLLVTNLSTNEIGRHWHDVEGGQINRVSKVDGESELISKGWYVTKEQFADPERGETGFPNYKTIGHSRDILAYSDSKAKRKRVRHAREDVEERLLSGDVEGRPLCDRTAYVAALEKALPQSIGEKVTIFGGGSGRLVRWSPEEALVVTEGKLRHLDPFAVAPAEMPVPQIFERTLPERRHDLSPAAGNRDSEEKPQVEKDTCTAPGEIGPAQARERDAACLASVFEVETETGEIDRSVRWKGPVEAGQGPDVSPVRKGDLCYSIGLQDLLYPKEEYWRQRRTTETTGGKLEGNQDSNNTDEGPVPMSSIKESTIEGFNDFLADQREQDGDARITLIQFDNSPEELWVDRPLEEAFELDEGHYVTSGGTALNDAVGKGIQEAKARAARSNEERERIYVVVTDGRENSSQEFSHDEIQDMIESERDEGREFVFLAANQNAMETASDYGIDTNKSITYASQRRRKSGRVQLHLTRRKRDAERGRDSEGLFHGRRKTRAKRSGRRARHCGKDPERRRAGSRRRAG